MRFIFKKHKTLFLHTKTCKGVVHNKSPDSQYCNYKLDSGKDGKNELTHANQ